MYRIYILVERYRLEYLNALSSRTNPSVSIIVHYIIASLLHEPSSLSETLSPVTDIRVYSERVRCITAVNNAARTVEICTGIIVSDEFLQNFYNCFTIAWFILCNNTLYPVTNTHGHAERMRCITVETSAARTVDIGPGVRFF